MDKESYYLFILSWTEEDKKDKGDKRKEGFAATKYS